MAGQRNRIWATRIVVLIAVFFVLAFAANRVWLRLTQAPIDETPISTMATAMQRAWSIELRNKLMRRSPRLRWSNIPWHPF